MRLYENIIAKPLLRMMTQFLKFSQRTILGWVRSAMVTTAATRVYFSLEI